MTIIAEGNMELDKGENMISGINFLTYIKDNGGSVIFMDLLNSIESDDARLHVVNTMRTLRDMQQVEFGFDEDNNSLYIKLTSEGKRTIALDKTERILSLFSLKNAPKILGQEY